MADSKENYKGDQGSEGIDSLLVLMNTPKRREKAQWGMIYLAQGNKPVSMDLSLQSTRFWSRTRLVAYRGGSRNVFFFRWGADVDSENTKFLICIALHLKKLRNILDKQILSCLRRNFGFFFTHGSDGGGMRSVSPLPKSTLFYD